MAEQLGYTNCAHDKRPSRLPSVPTYFPSSARPYTESTSSRPRCLDQPEKCFPSQNVRLTISLPLCYRGISCEILRSLRGCSGSDTCFALGPCSEDSNPRDSTTYQHPHVTLPSNRNTMRMMATPSGSSEAGPPVTAKITRGHSCGMHILLSLQSNLRSYCMLKSTG